MNIKVKRTIPIPFITYHTAFYLLTGKRKARKNSKLFYATFGHTRESDGDSSFGLKGKNLI